MSPIQLSAVVLLVSVTLAAGLQIEREHLVAVLKNTGLLARMLLANVVIVPILGVVLVAIFHLPEDIAVGVLLMAIAPGVPFALQAAGRKKGGSQGFAIVLVFVCQLVSVVTVPLTANLVLPQPDRVKLAAGAYILKLVLFQLLPLVIGYLIADRAAALARKLVRPVLLIFALSALTLIAMLGGKILGSFATVYGSGGLMASFALVVLSIVAGYLLGGPDPADRRTLAIGTGLRNIGLASLIATTSFADTDVPAAVIVYLVIQFVTCTIAGVYFTRTSKAAAAA